MIEAEVVYLRVAVAADQYALNRFMLDLVHWFAVCDRRAYRERLLRRDSVMEVESAQTLVPPTEEATSAFLVDQVLLPTPTMLGLVVRLRVPHFSALAIVVMSL